MEGTLHILDRSGDTPVAWDTEKKDGPLDPAYAEAEFNRLVAQGHLAFGTTEAGENIQMRAFDPKTYPKITLTPSFVGG